MPDFTEILKIAVEEQDWKIICGLYKNITGETLEIPEQKDSDVEEGDSEEILKKDYSMEDILPQSEGKEVDRHQEPVYNDFTAPTKTSSSQPSGDNRRMRSEAVGSKRLENVVGVSQDGFVDDMTESLIDPETGESLTAQSKNVKITPRNKRKQLGMNDTSLMQVKCSVCLKTTSVSPTLAHGYSTIEGQNNWKCNDCSTRRSRLERSRNS